MTIALLFQTDQIGPAKPDEYAFIGELSLNGRVRPCNGILSMLTEARKCGIKSVIVPYDNRKEAETISGIRICPVKSLPDTVRFLEGKLDLKRQYAENRKQKANPIGKSAASPQETAGRPDRSDPSGRCRRTQCTDDRRAGLRQDHDRAADPHDPANDDGEGIP